MKCSIALLVFIVAGHTAALADQLVRNAQEELKTQGFYFGEVTGLNGPETTAAVRRFQIRNGLEVTGTLTKETLVALGLVENNPAPPTQLEAPAPAPASAPPPAPAPEPASRGPASLPRANPAPEVQPPPPPPVNLRRNESIAESDQNFLRRNEPRIPESVPPPREIPDPAPSGAEAFAEIFFRTPYENAPAALQRDTLKKAQTKLATQGMYYGVIDGLPGPDTEEAVLMYQRRHRLPMTGRLDLQTLDLLKLLPGRGGPQIKPFRDSRDGSPVYRGTIVR